LFLLFEIQIPTSKTFSSKNYLKVPEINGLPRAELSNIRSFRPEVSGTKQNLSFNACQILFVFYKHLPIFNKV